MRPIRPACEGVQHGLGPGSTHRGWPGQLEHSSDACAPYATLGEVVPKQIAILAPDQPRRRIGAIRPNKCM